MAQPAAVPNPTQCSRILDWLTSGKSLTAEQALSAMGIARCAARIQDLRDAGNIIKTRMITVRNRYGEPCRVAEYTLKKSATPKKRTRAPKKLTGQIDMGEVWGGLSAKGGAQ